MSFAVHTANTEHRRISGVCFSTSLRCNPQTCSEETVVFLRKVLYECREIINSQKEPPPFEKKFETHIALLRWQTIMPPSLKPAETYWRPPKDIEDPGLRGEVHSNTMFVYAGLVVLFIWLLGRVPSRLDSCARVPKDRFAGRLVVTGGSSVIGFWLAAFLAAHLLHLYIVGHW